MASQATASERWWRELALALLALLALPALACGEEASSQPDADGGQVSEGEGERAPAACPAGPPCAFLTAIEPASTSFELRRTLGVEGERVVKLRYWQEDPAWPGGSLGIAGAAVDWRLETDPAEPALENAVPEQARTVTDAQGYTTNRIRAGRGATRFRVVVQAPLADPLTYQVTISTCLKELAISVRYPAGLYLEQGFDRVTVRGFPAVAGQTLPCEAIDPHDPPPSAEFLLEVPLPLSEAGSTVHWAWAQRVGQQYTVLALAERLLPGADPGWGDRVAVAAACTTIDSPYPHPVALDLVDLPVRRPGAG